MGESVYKPVFVPGATAAAEFLTVRDMWRWATARLAGAGLFHGHGSETALDEAAFIVLEGLGLPIESIDPWLEARLAPAERARLAELVEARIATRKPASYLLNKAYIQGVPFYVDERVIVPRSYIGEMLFSDGFVGGEGALIPDPGAVGSVLDLCSGSGCLAILAARVFPAAEVHAVELSPEAAAVARINIKDHGLEERIALHEGDLFAPLQGRRFDLIISNPPYVDAQGMDWLQPEHRHEPAMAFSGGPDGLEIVRRILAEAPAHLTPEGALLCEVGRLRPALEAAFPQTPFLWLDSEASEGETFWITAERLCAAPAPRRKRPATRPT